MATGTQKTITIDKEFIGGLKTEYTGLNFPDNSCIDCNNLTFNRTGKVSRRLGINLETNKELFNLQRSTNAISSYWWKNASGDGVTSLYVLQVGINLYFYNSSEVTSSSPLSKHKLVSSVSLAPYTASGSTFDVETEVQFSDGEGHLFVVHKDMDPIYIDYNSSLGTFTVNKIIVRIRDFVGILESGVEDNYRPGVLTNAHTYNLSNQGWGKSWSTTSNTSNSISTGAQSFSISSSLPIQIGDRLSFAANSSAIGINTPFMIGVVTFYSGGTVVVNVTEINNTGTYADWTVTPSPAFIAKWLGAVGNYPSNADVWWYFKNTDNEFDPATTVDNVTLAGGRAARGYHILDAFNQDRSAASSISGLSSVTSGGKRPLAVAWFAGRVWYAGVTYKGFNEKLYFSQIIETRDQFGKCYQVNDPTSDEKFDLLPSDGGEISIQGIGHVHKLIPTTNGLLIFGSRGIWFVTGNSGIGFTANDFTITKISSIESLSPYSFVDVSGTPVWWNQDGIYTLVPQQGGFQVTSITQTTIASFYQSIPLKSKYYARGYYNPITFRIQWLYKDTEETSVFDRYSFTNILNFDTQINAFYPWKITSSPYTLSGIIVLGGNGIDTTVDYKFKYLATSNDYISFAEERATTYLDWNSVDYSSDSYMITGTRIYGDAVKRFQNNYIDIFASGEESWVNIQARWDFASSSSSNRWSSSQQVVFGEDYRDNQRKRRRIRGQGRVVQLKFSAVTTHPMNLIGWATGVEANQIP